MKTKLTCQTSYLDPYSATNPLDPAFFGDKSIVFHYSNKTRISCANFTLVKEGTPVPSGGASSGYPIPTGINGNSSMYPGPTGTGGSNGPTIAPTAPTFNPSEPSASAPPEPTSGASKVMVAGAGVLAGAFALIL